MQTTNDFQPFINLMQFIENDWTHNKFENEDKILGPLSFKLFNHWCGSVRYMHTIEKTDPYLFLLFGECLDIINDVFCKMKAEIDIIEAFGQNLDTERQIARELGNEAWNRTLSLYVEILSYLTHNKGLN